MMNIVKIGLALVIFFISACSGIEPKPHTEQAQWSENLSYLILGFSWQDRYFNNDTGLWVEIPSQALLQSEAVLKKRRSQDPLYFKLPLYHHFNRFELVFGGEAKFKIPRFNREVKSYDHYVIYSLPPGKYEISYIRYREHKLYDRSDQPFRAEATETVRDQLFQAVAEIPKLKWQLEANKVYYLGDIKMYMQTNIGQLGFLDRYATESIDIKKIEITNKFDEMKEEFFADKNWIPIDKLENIASPQLIKEEEIIIRERPLVY